MSHPIGSILRQQISRLDGWRRPRLRIDDSQASLDSEPVASPALADEDLFYSQDIYDEHVSEEVSVPGGLAPPGGALDYIALDEAVESESMEAKVLNEYYWQQHALKKSTQRAIKGFFKKGKVKFGGKWITTYHTLTQTFDPKIIASVETQLGNERHWWYSKAKIASPIKEPQPAAV